MINIKLVIYINPPYAEADNRKGEGRKGVAQNKIHDKYADLLKKAQRELFALFLTRIFYEIPNCIIAEFSTLKHLQAGNFLEFRNMFFAKLEKAFMVPGKTFDNVKGSFPIGFFIWNLLKKDKFENIGIDVLDSTGAFLFIKKNCSYDDIKTINKWIDLFRPDRKIQNSIGTMIGVASDFQNQRLNRIEIPYMKVPADNHNWQINETNLLQSCIYLAVRQCIEGSWINDRDQFLYPNEGWKTDKDFQSDCLCYTLFHGQNHISCETSINNWIPFTEEQVGLKNSFKSHFMSDYIAGKIIPTSEADLIKNESIPYMGKLVFSSEAQKVYDSGL